MKHSWRTKMGRVAAGVGLLALWAIGAISQGNHDRWADPIEQSTAAPATTVAKHDRWADPIEQSMAAPGTTVYTVADWADPIDGDPHGADQGNQENHGNLGS